MVMNLVDPVLWQKPPCCRVGTEPLLGGYSLLTQTKPLPRIDLYPNVGGYSDPLIHLLGQTFVMPPVPRFMR